MNSSRTTPAYFRIYFKLIRNAHISFGVFFSPLLYATSQHCIIFKKSAATPPKAVVYDGPGIFICTTTGNLQK